MMNWLFTTWSVSYQFIWIFYVVNILAFCHFYKHIFQTVVFCFPFVFSFAKRGNVPVSNPLILLLWDVLRHLSFYRSFSLCKCDKYSIFFEPFWGCLVNRDCVSHLALILASMWHEVYWWLFFPNSYSKSSTAIIATFKNCSKICIKESRAPEGLFFPRWCPLQGPGQTEGKEGWRKKHQAEDSSSDSQVCRGWESPVRRSEKARGFCGRIAR